MHLLSGLMKFCKHTHTRAHTHTSAQASLRYLIHHFLGVVSDYRSILVGWKPTLSDFVGEVAGRFVRVGEGGICIGRG